MMKNMKRHTKSVISIVLALVLIVSTVAVGIIATNAAYLNEKPVLLVCDNTVFVKKLPEVEPVMNEFNAECGFPYDGAKEHFILDIENRELLDKVIPLLEKITPVPKKRKK